jgi:exosortase K
VVLGIKAWASHASAEGLRWLLLPTVALVEDAHVGRFDWMGGEGYLDADARFLVAPACAGVNFLCAALLTGVMGFAGKVRSWRGASLLLSGSAVAAYLCTVVSNALRIGLAMALHANHSSFAGLLPEADAHRLLGIVVYTGALLTLHLSAQLAAEGFFHDG